MLADFRWPDIKHEGDRQVIRNVREHGCHIAWIPDGDPEFAFSIGLYLNYGHPEIIIIGLDGDDAVAIINDIRDRVANGHRFAHRDMCADLLTDVDAYFVDVGLRAYPNYMGLAIWFYARLPRPFPCLQVVWPDQTGRFPWDPDSGADYRDYQALLGSPPWSN